MDEFDARLRRVLTEERDSFAPSDDLPARIARRTKQRERRRRQSGIATALGVMVLVLGAVITSAAVRESPDKVDLAAPSTPTTNKCPSVSSGTWSGTYRSNDGNLGGTLEARLVINETAVTGELKASGTPVDTGAAIAGTVDCAIVTFETLEPVGDGGIVIALRAVLDAKQANLNGRYDPAAIPGTAPNFSAENRAGGTFRAAPKP